MNIVKKITASMLALATCMSLAAVGAITANADDNTKKIYQPDNNGIININASDSDIKKCQTTHSEDNIEYQKCVYTVKNSDTNNVALNIKVRTGHHYTIIPLEYSFFFNRNKFKNCITDYENNHISDECWFKNKNDIFWIKDGNGNPIFNESGASPFHYGEAARVIYENKKEYTCDGAKANDNDRCYNLYPYFVKAVPDGLMSSMPVDYNTINLGNDVSNKIDDEEYWWHWDELIYPRIFDYMRTWDDSQQREFINNLANEFGDVKTTGDGSTTNIIKFNMNNYADRNGSSVLVTGGSYSNPIKYSKSYKYEYATISLPSGEAGVYLILDAGASPLLAVTGAAITDDPSSDISGNGKKNDLSTVESKPIPNQKINFCFKAKDFANDNPLSNAVFKLNGSDVYNANKEDDIQSSTSDENGDVCFNDIEVSSEFYYKKYTITETKAPDGYVGSKQRFHLTFTNNENDNGKIIEGKYLEFRQYNYKYTSGCNITTYGDTYFSQQCPSNPVSWMEVVRNENGLVDYHYIIDSPWYGDNRDYLDKTKCRAGDSHPIDCYYMPDDKTKTHDGFNVVMKSNLMLNNKNGEAWNKDQTVAYFYKPSTNDGDMPHTGSYTMWAIVGIATILMGGALFLLRRAQKVKD